MGYCYSSQRGTERERIAEGDAGWSSSVARWAHNPEVTGSNPVPATKKHQRYTERPGSDDPGLSVYLRSAWPGPVRPGPEAARTRGGPSVVFEPLVGRQGNGPGLGKIHNAWRVPG